MSEIRPKVEFIEKRLDEVLECKKSLWHKNPLFRQCLEENKCGDAEMVDGYLLCHIELSYENAQ